MNVSITFRHMEPTEPLKQHVHHCLAKIEKFFLKPVEVHVALTTEKHIHHAEVQVKDVHFSAHASESGENMYAAIDKAINRVGKSLKKHKDKIKNPKISSDAPTSNS